MADMVFKLPNTIARRMDILRLEHQLEQLSEAYDQAKLRNATETSDLPRPSRLLEDIADDNGFNLLKPDDRGQLAKFLQDTKVAAPVLHISFAVDPSTAVLKKLITWLRDNIDPLLLIDVGLQPDLGAGCIVRTPNKYFDFSIRQFLQGKRPELIEAIAGEQEQV